MALPTKLLDITSIFKGTKYGEHQGVGKIEKAYDVNTDGKTLKLVTIFDNLGRTIKIAEFYANTVFLKNHDLSYLIVYYVTASNGTIEYSEKQSNNNTKRLELLVYRANTKYNVNHKSMTQVSKKFIFRSNDSVMEEFYYNTLGNVTQINLFRDGTIYEKRTPSNIYRIVYLKRDTKNTLDMVDKVEDYNTSGVRTVLHWIEPTLYTQNYMGKVTRKFTFRANGSVSEEFYFSSPGKISQVNLFKDGTNYDKRDVPDIARIYHFRTDGTLLEENYVLNGQTQSKTVFKTGTKYETRKYEDITQIFAFRANGTLSEEKVMEVGVVKFVNFFSSSTVYEQRTIKNIYQVLIFRTDGSLEEEKLLTNGIVMTRNHFRAGTVTNSRTIKDITRAFYFRANGSLKEEHFLTNGVLVHINHFRDGTIYEKRTSADITKSEPINQAPVVQWPVSGASVTCGIGCYYDHIGVDIGAPAWTPIKTILNGTIIDNGYSSSYGNYIIVASTHNGVNYTILYGHMVQRSGVPIGAKVSSGNVIGHIGNTGISEGNHVHVETLKGINYFPWDKNNRRGRAVDFRNEFGVWR